MFERCAYCKTTIVAGGVRGFDGRCYCSEEHKRRVEGDREHEGLLAARARELAQLEQARVAYESRLAKLRANPADPATRGEALNAGRVYAAWKRHFSGEGGLVQAFDEAALANDLAAAAAAAAAPNPEPAPNHEQRLERLEALRKRGLISEQEYADKRSAILAEL